MWNCFIWFFDMKVSSPKESKKTTSWQQPMASVHAERQGLTKQEGGSIAGPLPYTQSPHYSQ